MPGDDAAAGTHEAFRPEHRLHTTSWLFVAAGYVKSFIVPLIAAAFVGANRDTGVWLPLFMVVPLIAAALWHQWVFRYGFSQRGLVIHEGLFFRNVRTIDYTRIENVDTERSLLHRLFGVAQVRVETSTGGQAEAVIRVLDLDAVAAMRERIFGERGRRTAGQAAGAREGAAAGERPLLALPPGELVRFGLIDNRGMLLVAAALGVLSQGGFFEAMGERLQPWLERLPWETIVGFGLLAQILLGLVTIVALIAATRLLSVALALITLYGFTLTRAGDDLHARYGLLTRVALTMRRRRIQAVHQTATLLHRLFRRVSLRVDLAGGITSGGEGAQTGVPSPWRELWLAPLCPPDETQRLIRAAIPETRLDELKWYGLAPRARRRIFRLWCWGWLLLAGLPAALMLGWWALAVVAAPAPLFYLHATMYVRHTGWALSDELFALKRGWLTRRLSIAPRSRVQSVRWSESPFDRRFGMARLDVDHAGASASHPLSLPYLARDDAERLAAALYRPTSGHL